MHIGLVKIAAFKRTLKEYAMHCACLEQSKNGDIERQNNYGTISNLIGITTKSAEKKTTLHRNNAIQLKSQAYIATLLTRHLKQY